MTTALEDLTRIMTGSTSSATSAQGIDTYTRRVIREELAELVASVDEHHAAQDTGEESLLNQTLRRLSGDDRTVSLNAVLGVIDHIEHFYDDNPFNAARSNAQQIAGWKAAAVNMRGQVRFLAGVTPYARVSA